MADQPAPAYNNKAFENPQPVQPVQPGPTTVVVQTSQPQVVQPPPVIHFTENPQAHHCAFCNDNIVTNTKIEMGTGSWIAVGALLFLTGICCCLPCCIDSCQDVTHSCPKCNRIMGKKKFLGM